MQTWEKKKTTHSQTSSKKKKVTPLQISITLRLIPIKFETLKPPIMYITINLAISSICHKLYFGLYCKTKDAKDFDLLQSTVFGLKKWCHTRLSPGYLEAHGVDPRSADGSPVDVRDSPVVRRLLQQSHTRAGWAAGGLQILHEFVSWSDFVLEGCRLDYLCRWGRSWLLMPLRPLLITYAIEAALDYLCRWGRSWLLLP